ncbi:hypothetical protein [Verrucomicrobium sp. 3C]|uniref:hypothetical protein n=1 Tax=Verrucomicrobium sp. 3C TaxID=1134055 RepID=UPI000370519B|nr:hypothetical protein [Verrucomicrobium sp. 3C]
MAKPTEYCGGTKPDWACLASMKTRLSLLSLVGKVLVAASLLAIVACSEKPKPQPTQQTPAPTYQPLDHKS